ncbi:MAG: hypothetical protein KOO69_02130 [Victivallales bacterium]|nr:hypothetical protein [Victivallales bacterium]
MSNILKKVFFGAVVFSTISSCFADFWEDITPYRGPKRDVITLIITSNYKHPLVIAQLLQDDTKQPYLLLPAINGKGIFFNPPRERSEEALEINEENLARFISFLNPKQIVILGGNEYVADKYRKMIAKEIPLITIEGDDWVKISERVSILLDARNVAYDYKKLGRELNSSLYKPKRTRNISTAPSDGPVKDIDLDEIIVEKKADTIETKDVKEGTKEAIDPKAELLKEPEIVMPKSTPELIKDK